MPKVYGIHMVELSEGVTTSAFERFVLEEFLPALPLHRTPGVIARLLRADRGDRAQKYVFMFEFDSLETRNRYFPEPQRISEELAELIAPLREVSQIWSAMTTRVKTDYVVVGEAPAAAHGTSPA